MTFFKAAIRVKDTSISDLLMLVRGLPDATLLGLELDGTPPSSPNIARVASPPAPREPRTNPRPGSAAAIIMQHLKDFGPDSRDGILQHMEAQGISHNTAARTLSGMVQDGLAVRVQGGTYTLVNAIKKRQRHRGPQKCEDLILAHLKKGGPDDETGIKALLVANQFSKYTAGRMLWRMKDKGLVKEQGSDWAAT